MKWSAFFIVIINVLDIIHDVLCPYFRDDKDKK